MADREKHPHDNVSIVEREHLINLDEAIAALSNVPAGGRVGDCIRALRALPTVSVTDEIEALREENARLNTALDEQARVMDLWSAQLDTILEELKGRK